MIEKQTIKQYYTTQTEYKQYEAMQQLASKQLNDYVRFSQGELYFELKDFETAIYKWEKVQNPTLAMWAQKNIGDAYLKLEEYTRAEKALLQVKSDEKQLQLEKLLALNELYEKTNASDKQYIILKALVALDVSYKKIFQQSVHFFEQHAYYQDALEAIMLSDLQLDKTWVEKIHRYFEQDDKGLIQYQDILTKYLNRLALQQPELFPQAFCSITSHMLRHKRAEAGLQYFIARKAKSDQAMFRYNFKQLVQLLDALYEQYEDVAQLTECFKTIIPELVRKTDDLQAIKVLKSYIGERVTADGASVYELTELATIYEKTQQMLQIQKLPAPQYEQYMWQHYISSKPAIMLVGGYNSGKSSFINSVLGEEVLKADIIPTTSALTILHDGPQKSLLEFQKGIVRATSFEDLKNVSTIHHEQSAELSTSIIGVTVDNTLLKDVTLIDTPGFFDDQENTETNPTFDYIGLADEILFSLTIDKPFSRNEKLLAEKLLTLAPQVKLAFVLNQVDRADEEELEEIEEDLERKFKKSFEQSHALYCYSAYEPDDYAQPMLRYFKAQRIIHVERRLTQLIPIMQSFASKAKQQLGVQLKQSVVELKRLEEQLEAYNERFEQLSNELDKNEEVLEQGFKEYCLDFSKIKTEVLQIIRELSQEVHYETTLSYLTHTLNETLNQRIEYYMRNTANLAIQQSVIQWFNVAVRNIQPMLKPLQQNLEPFVLEKDKASFKNVVLNVEALHPFVTKGLQQLSQIQYSKQAFITNDSSLMKWLSNFGKVFGMKNHEYLKIDKLREYLMTHTFEEHLDQIFLSYENSLTAFFDEIFDELCEPFNAYEDFIEQFVNHHETLRNEDQARVNELRQSYPVKLNQWVLLEAKLKQLDVLYGQKEPEIVN